MRLRLDRKSWGARLVQIGGLLGLSLAIAGGAHPAQAQPASTLLSGFVFDATGRGVPGATITAYTLSDHTRLDATATTGATGAFQLDPGPGTLVLRGAAPGLDPAEQTVYNTSYQTGITFILRPTHDAAELAGEIVPLVATISGQVTSLDDVPLGGMSIIVAGQRDTGVQQIAPPPAYNITTTKGNGRYSVRVPAGDIWMTLKTGFTWGYQLTPLTIHNGQLVHNADFKVAIRVLPLLAFPTSIPTPDSAGPPTPLPAVPTAAGEFPLSVTTPTPLDTPFSVVSPVPSPSTQTSPAIGMPSTGQPAVTLELGSALWAGALLVLTGLAIGMTTQRRSSSR